jgi:hypothetical protein
MTEIKCSRVRRSWIEKLMMWRRAYETRITEGHHEICARGPSREESQKVARKLWALRETQGALLGDFREGSFRNCQAGVAVKSQRS